MKNPQIMICIFLHQFTIDKCFVKRVPMFTCSDELYGPKASCFIAFLQVAKYGNERENYDTFYTLYP